MKITIILIFILIVSILFLLVRRYKQEEHERLEKSKKLIQNIINKIPKKMKKIMKKSNDTFPTGAVELASTIADSQPGLGKKEDKLIEAFEDIKDIRYGKLGASNSVDGATTNKWIKVSSFTVSGPWDPRGFTLEVYPRIRTVSSSRQTLVCLVRNADKDIEAPYVSLNTHNEAEPNSRFIKDVRVVRTGGSGITSNTVEVWIQMGHPWATTGYVMYYLYNFKTNDFVATVPQAQVDNPPSGQSWGISENIEPQNGKGNIKIDGQINTMGRTNYPPGWGGGVRTYDVYSSATVAVGDESGNVKGYMNSSGDASFSGTTIAKKIKANSELCISDTCINETDLKRYKNILPKGKIEIVNRRPLFGVGVKTKPGPFWGNNAQPLVDYITYGPFGYNVPAVAPGAVRKFRMYGVYSDGMTGGAGPVVRVSILNRNWTEYGKFVDFQFPLTWGGLEETRDAFSNVVNDPEDGMHGILYTFVPAGSTGNNAVRWQYVELQTLDIY
jgi:hypothetical protein